MTSGTRVWFEDLTGHVVPPEQLVFTPPPRLDITVNPTPTLQRSAIQLTVHVVDHSTKAAVAGNVTLNTYLGGWKTLQFPTNAPFSTTLNGQLPRGPKGEIGEWIDPSATVTVVGYPITSVPFQFGTPVPHHHCHW